MVNKQTNIENHVHIYTHTHEASCCPNALCCFYLLFPLRSNDSKQLNQNFNSNRFLFGNLKRVHDTLISGIHKTAS